MFVFNICGEGILPPTDLRNLLSMLELGFYVVPEIQRGFVWKNQDVVELLNSICNRLPIGSIILWHMPSTFAKNYRDLLVPLIDELKDKIDNGQYLVIDGQQRLISLLLSKYGEITKMGKKRRINLLYCIDVGEGIGEFTLEKKGDYCISSKDILAFRDPFEILERYKIKDELISSRVLRILNNVMNVLSTYQVNLVQVDQSIFEPYIVQDDFVGFLEKLSDMFVKLNMQGHRVRMPDLVVALLDPAIRAKLQRSFRDKMNEIDLELSALGWDIDEPVYIRLFMAIATGITRFREFRQAVKSIEENNLVDALDEMKESLRHAIDYLKDMNIKNQDGLTSRYQLVTLGYYMYVARREGGYVSPGGIKKWLILCAINKRYTGRLETDLHEDILTLREKKDIKEVAKNYRIKSVDVSYFNTTIKRELKQILLILLDSAYDFPTSGSRTPRQLRHLGRRELQMHHIFPRKLLERFYRGREKIEIAIGNSKAELDVEEACNHFGNITFISETSNESIRDSDPERYLSEIPKEIREQHFMPLDVELYKLENYTRFVEERIKLIADKVNRLLGI